MTSLFLVLKKIKTEKKRKMSLLYDQLEKARKDLLQVKKNYDS